MSRDFRLSCPLPNRPPETIQLAHGGGGRMMRSLLERLFLPAFANQWLDARHDSAVMRIGAEQIAFTTDSYVVSPLFFPGGDIGKLAVFGTVNDLAMAGAHPLYLSAGFILEEGLPLATLEAIVASMREAAAVADVELVTGDTKVVDRGKGNAVFINTAGIGAAADVEISPRRVQPGDAVILSGDVGRHGIAIMSVRKGLNFETALESDCAPLWQPVSALLQNGVDVHCMRDLTRGGLASALNEIAFDAGVAIAIDERAVPVSAGSSRVRTSRARSAVRGERRAVRGLCHGGAGEPRARRSERLPAERAVARHRHSRRPRRRDRRSAGRARQL